MVLERRYNVKREKAIIFYPYEVPAFFIKVDTLQTW